MNKMMAMRVGVFAALLLPAAAGATGWGLLARSFVVEKIAANWNGGSLAAYYGAAGVDVFSTSSSAWCQAELHFLTHREYWRFWNVQGSAPISFDYSLGLAAQNDTWGTDSTAVTDGLIFGQGEGYITAKAALLAEDLPLADFGVELPAEQAAEVYESLISFAVDSRLARSRRHLGAVLAAAARRRTEQFPGMLVDAYAATAASVCGTDTAQVARVIEIQEQSFRRYVFDYGRQVLARGERGIGDFIVRWAQATKARWNQKGIHFVTVAQLRRIARFAMPLAENLVRYDYLPELRATAEQVQDEAFRQLKRPADGNSGGGSDGGGDTGDTTDGGDDTDTNGDTTTDAEGTE